MYCYDVCVCVSGRVYSVLGTSSSDRLVTSDLFVSIMEAGVLPPANDTPVGVQLRSPHLENIYACEPKATHSNLLFYQNQKCHVQQCNNASLCL